MSSRPWVRIPPALLIFEERWSTDRRGSDGTTAAQSVGRNVQLASLSLQADPVRGERCGHALAGVPMGNSWRRGNDASERRLCLRLRGAEPAFRPSWGRSSEEQSTRLSSERPPVRARSSPFRGGRGVDGSTRGCDPRRRRFEPGRSPLTHADAEHRRAQQAVTLSPRAVVVRLHPSALGDVAQREEHLACTEQKHVRVLPSPPLPP